MENVPSWKVSMFQKYMWADHYREYVLVTIFVEIPFIKPNSLSSRLLWPEVTC